MNGERELPLKKEVTRVTEKVIIDPKTVVNSEQICFRLGPTNEKQIINDLSFSTDCLNTNFGYLTHCTITNNSVGLKNLNG